MIKKVLAILVCLLPLLCIGQASISGLVTDETGKVVGNVSVSYRKMGGAAILGFARTGIDGRFNLSVRNSDVDSVQLDFAHLSYKKKTAVVANRTAEYTFMLESGVQEIE